MLLIETQNQILAPVFLTGILILTTHILLGIEVLKRGIIFLDIAIAQIVFLAIVIAYQLHWDIWQVQIFALGSAIITAWILQKTEQWSTNLREAVIGIFFVLAISISIILLEDNSDTNQFLKQLLVGNQLLWVTLMDLIFTGIIYFFILAFWFTIHIHKIIFYIFFAICITLSVQLVGIFLVFASLIVPALFTYSLQDNKERLITSFIIGIVGYLGGISLSAIWDLPVGATIICCLIMTGLVLLPLILFKAKQAKQ